MVRTHRLALLSKASAPDQTSPVEEAQTTQEGNMIEPVVVPFIWLILFLLVVVHDADRQNDRTHHQSTRDRLARSMKELSPVLDV